ncbi:YdcF family protein [Facklamia sp. 7083-14-GEN3]|uniref:YdcF family protein n=1 Tax=Facklamia sp. 7083-14-GEN3 TaxID=2973478 RepID=UPI00215CFE22|nr:YdcF family protein [Facklamia sp. 7083-14-GEN3]MCR8968943.1 YdcF family protein [Facklamia sp. 7083-14-GEN3]
MKKWGLLSLSLIFISYLVWLARNLDIGQEPIEADVVVVPGGEIVRSLKAAELIQDGYVTSNKMIVSPLNEVIGTKPLIDFITDTGLSEDQVIGENEATSTWSNANNTISIMEEMGWKTALVVTTDYHTRRTKLAFDRASKDKDLKFHYVSAYLKDSEGKEVAYGDSRKALKIMFSEVYKYIGYYLKLYYWIDE